MNPQVKEKWVNALRSGEYKQDISRLRSNDGNSFCCLGVLCDLYAKEHNEDWQENENVSDDEFFIKDKFHFDGESEYLPESVVKWAELDGNCPNVFVSSSSEMSLAEINDNGWSFVEISLEIEKQL